MEGQKSRFDIKFKYKAMALFLVTALFVGLTSQALSQGYVKAAEMTGRSTHTHKVCEGSDCGDGAHTDMEWQAWSDGSAMPDVAGNYYLDTDVTLATRWEPGDGVTNLCLNGHTLKSTDTSDDGTVIRIASGAELNLCDCSVQKSGTITGSTPNAVTFTNKSGGGQAPQFFMYGGTITGIDYANSDTYTGAAVNLTVQDAQFHMRGGKITNNGALGVDASGGQFFVSGTVDISNNGTSYVVMLEAMSQQLAAYGVDLGNVGANMDIGILKGNYIQIEAPISMLNKSSVFMPSQDMTFCGSFTSGWDSKMSGKSPDKYFTSATDAFIVVLPKDDTEAALQRRPAHTHTLVHHEAVAPTCTEDGTGEYWKCEGDTGCNKMFSDAAGTTAISQIPSGGAATSHSWGAWRITQDPTLTAKGTVERLCTKNPAHKDEKELAELSDRNVWTATTLVPPTPDRDGSQEYTSEYGTVTVVIPKTEGGNSGTVDKEVEKEENVPDVGFCASAGELAQIVLTEAEKQQMEDGVDIKIVLNVKDASDSVSDEDKAAAYEAMKDFKAGQYLDISLFKIIGEERRQISETTAKIRITIAIPDSLKSGDSYKEAAFAMIRVHDGKAEILDDLDDSEDTVTIETDRFSTYVMAYKDAADSENNGDSGDDSDSENNDDDNDSGDDGNVSDNGSNQGGRKDDEPQTGGYPSLEQYATLAMIASFAYLILYLVQGSGGMTEETKKKSAAP